MLINLNFWSFEVSCFSNKSKNYFLTIIIEYVYYNFDIRCVIVINVFFRNTEVSVQNERLRIQLAERERTVAELQRAMTVLDERRRAGGRGAADREGGAEEEEDARPETEAMHDALRRIAQEVVH